MKMFCGDLRELNTMAWDIDLTGADQTLNCQDSNVHLLTISHSVDNMRLWYFTLKRHLVQYQFSS